MVSLKKIRYQSLSSNKRCSEMFVEGLICNSREYCSEYSYFAYNDMDKPSHMLDQENESLIDPVNKFMFLHPLILNHVPTNKNISINSSLTFLLNEATSLQSLIIILI